MIVDQMQSKIQVSFLDDITLSANPMFMAQQLIQRYSDEIVNIIIECDTSEEKEVLKKELGRRVNSLKVSNN